MAISFSRIKIYIDKLTALEKQDVELEKNRYDFLKYISAISSLFLLSFSSISLIQGDYIIAIVDFVFAALMNGNTVYLIKTRDLDLSGSASLGLLAILFILLMFSPEIDKSSSLWALVFPIVTAFIFGMRKGFFINISFIAIVIVLFLMDVPANKFDPHFKLRFIGVFTGIYTIAIFFVFARIQAQYEIMNKNVELVKIVSELNNIQETLKEREKKYRRLIDRAKEAILIIEEDQIKLFNPAFSSLLGYDQFEMGNSIKDYLHQDDYDVTLAYILDREIKYQSRNGIESSLLHKDGSKVYVEIYSELESKSEESAKIVFLRDITPFKTAKDNLKYEIDLLNNLFNYLPDSIFYKDAELRYVMLNKSQAVFLGRENIDEIIGRTDKDFIPEEFSTELYNEEANIIETGVPVTDKELCLRNDEGDQFWFLSAKVPIYDDSGKVAGIMGLTKDITEQKFKESELTKHIEELQINRDQTEETAGELAYLNAKLEESESKFRDLNAKKDRFFSIIAHDLKSPFVSLLGFSDFLLHDIDEMEKDEIREFVESINKSAGQLFKLLENLLQWARIQTDRIEFTPVTFKINELVDNLIDLYHMNLSQKNITLVTEIEPDMEVFGDKNMIETVIRNLFSNSIKFTYPGKSIHISVIKQDKFIKVSVKDEGVGISPENIKKLFKIEEHLTTEGTNSERGTGLGLILCKDFVIKNGGEIWVESEVGQGSSFNFTIPLPE